MISEVISIEYESVCVCARTNEINPKEQKHAATSCSKNIFDLN